MVVVHPRIYLISCVESKDEKNEIKHPSKISTFTVIIIGHTVNVEIFDASKFRTFCTRPTILKFRAHKFSSVILT